MRALGSRQRGLLLALLLALPACTSSPSASKDSPKDSASSDTGDSADGPTADESLLRALIATESPDRAQVEQVFGEIALSQGLPIATVEGTFLFAALSAEERLYLAGDFDTWSGQLMNAQGMLRWIELEIPDPIDAGYKFWDGADSWEPDPWGRRYTYDAFGEMSLVAADRAHLERWPGLSGQGLQPRTVRVWVPDSGLFDRVLVAHDAQNLFDPEAPWGGWRLQDSLPPEMLVVAVDNTPDRMEEYTHVQDIIHGESYGGWGDQYTDFIELDLRPLMGATYGESETWGQIGSSLGGLISLHAADRHPGVYRFVASLSGTLGWGRIGASNETIIERHAAHGHRDTAIYLDSGGEYETCADSDADGIHDDDPSSTDNVCETLQMRDLLSDLGYTFDVDLWHWWEPGAEHNEAAWADRVWRPLELFAGL